MQHHDAADDVEIPAQQVDAGKCQVLGANHHGHQKVSQHSGDRRNQEEEDHHHAMHGEELVIGIGLNQVARRGQQFEANEKREETSNKEEERDRREVKQRDALVVGGQQPGRDTVLFIEIIFALNRLNSSGSHAHST